MLRDIAKEYFIEKDHNCAESVLFAANDYYGWGLDREALKLISAFGAGMGCGKTCGAICGAASAVGKTIVEDRAHATPNFGPTVGKMVGILEETYGSLNCSDIKPKYFQKEIRCLRTVEIACDKLEEYLKTLENN